MEDRATFDVVVLCSLVISKLLTSIDESAGVTKIASLADQERITSFKNRRCICKKKMVAVVSFKTKTCKLYNMHTSAAREECLLSLQRAP
jgi:hypothetical protein